ncbi:MAG: hypothetical protein E7363_01410 [Clostridiales bacterium]|nr:hypothetical protein [Clostridiales bacterium]
MIATVIVSGITVIGLISSVLFFPKIRVAKREFSTFWMVGLIGALAIFIVGGITLKAFWQGLTASGGMNPLKILILFLSMTFLSVFLDEVGFFSYLATHVTAHARGGQKTLFFVVYGLVSVLTVFTSNDVVILTFTPFLCYFAKNANISPVPYLVAEFCAANTWSMMLIIGNPTNVYLASASGITFLEYLKVMALPTVFAGVVQILVLLLLFRTQLKSPLSIEIVPKPLKEKLPVEAGIIHLAVCLVLLVFSSYMGLAMWLICVVCALSLLICSLVFTAVHKQKFLVLTHTVKRLPWTLVPFVLSMFTLVLALKTQGVTNKISGWLGQENVILRYGVSSFLACNLINNIPMSVLFATIPQMPTTLLTQQAIYATIIGSNVGAFLTPVGALAGIMFTELVRQKQVKFTFKTFVFYGVALAIPTLIAALLGLAILL